VKFQGASTGLEECFKGVFNAVLLFFCSIKKDDVEELPDLEFPLWEILGRSCLRILEVLNACIYSIWKYVYSRNAC